MMCGDLWTDKSMLGTTQQRGRKTPHLEAGDKGCYGAWLIDCFWTFSRDNSHSWHPWKPQIVNGLVYPIGFGITSVITQRARLQWLHPNGNLCQSAKLYWPCALMGKLLSVCFVGPRRENTCSAMKIAVDLLRTGSKMQPGYPVKEPEGSCTRVFLSSFNSAAGRRKRFSSSTCRCRKPLVVACGNLSTVGVGGAVLCIEKLTI